MIDGDSWGAHRRIEELDRECGQRGVNPRASDDEVAAFVPTWKIETWFAYLDGQDVDENCRSYPKLNRPRDCRKHVHEPARMCRSQKFREAVPQSLILSCQEFNLLKK